MVTVLDVLDNFFDAAGEDDVARMSGTKLYELGMELGRYADLLSTPAIDVASHPVYLGGWPSANFWLADHGRLVMSSLLYSGQVLAKDPLCDWFAPQQYRRPRKMAARPGYVDAETRRPAVRETRRFLSIVVPALTALRPLIERGILVLVPSEKLLMRERRAIEDLSAALGEHLETATLEIVNRFSPADLAIEDNVRGMFVFAGGNREEQLRKAVGDAITYFAREFVFATLNNANYIAPFSFEQYLCERGLDRLVAASPSGRVVHALLSSRLPLFSGLTPALVADIHGDDNFAEFREQLYTVYRDVPMRGTEEEVHRHLMEAEETLLRPSMKRARREVERGVLGRIGVSATDLAIKIGVSMAVAAAYTPDRDLLDVAAESGTREGLLKLGRALRGRHAQGDAVTVWQKLYAHGRSARDELRLVSPQAGQLMDGPAFWGIPEQPGMTVSVSAGELILDFVPKPSAAVNHHEDVYGECGCGSGLKYKFCCRDLERDFRPGSG